MKLNTAQATITNCNTENNTFSIACNAAAFDILTSKLYSNTQLAVVRELLTNAYDSHKAANNLATPIKVTFPDYLNKVFSIRDYGTGLSKEDLMGLYVTFFSSTKSDTNDFTGCFGLGSKTPFSHSNSFSINSYFNGTKYSFIAVKKDGLPYIYCVSEVPTEEHNGLEISIPTQDTQFYKEALSYLEYIPEILITSNKEVYKAKLLEKIGNIYIYVNDRYTSFYLDNFLIKQGQNIYKLREYVKELDTGFLTEILRRHKVVIDVPIGTLTVKPDREGLSNDDINLKKISNFVKESVNKFKELITTESELIKKFDLTTYCKILSDKYLKDYKYARFVESYDSDKNQNIITLFLNNCYIHRIAANHLYTYKDMFDDNLIIISKVFFDRKDKNIIKLTNILHNYSDEFNVGKGLTVITPYQDQQNSSEFYRFLINLTKTCNNIKEHKFNYKLITLEKFYKKYPNTKGPKSISKSEKYDPTTKRINYYHTSINSNKYKELSGVCNSTISVIKDTYSVDNTIVLQEHGRVSEYIRLLNTFMYNIYDNEGNDFIRDYFSKYLPSLQNCSLGLTFLIVAQSNMQYFKEYVKFAHKDTKITCKYTPREEVFDVIDNAQWTVNFIKRKNNEISIARKMQDMIKTIDLNFRGKTLKWLQNGIVYFRLTKLYNYYTTLYDVLPNSIEDKTATFLETNETYMVDLKDRVKYYIIPDRLPYKLELIDNEVMSHSTPKTYQQNKNNARKLKTTYSNKLTTDLKLRLLSIVRDN